jgi:nickel-dependent lactate racemase
MWFHYEGETIDRPRRMEAMRRLLEEATSRIGASGKKALLLPPDITRFHSGAGELTNILYHLLGTDCETNVIPTLGQHVPHTPEQNTMMFGDIPNERIFAHDWRAKVERIGEIPKDYVRFVSDDAVDWPIPVEINRNVLDDSYDLIVNIGQVVPHEVLGFANHNKNYFIGLAGKGMITASHMMAATCGIENNLGQFITPLRACFNKAERETLGGVPHVYVLVVCTRNAEGELEQTGLYVGEDLETYLAAARYARAHTITMLDEPLKKVVAVMDPDEFHSTWVSNKAIYRTRMAMADGGELVIIAPGVERFGEQKEVDDLIRKYGYKGTPNTVKHWKAEADLQDLGHGAAHLIHGSSEGRFTITYAPGHLTKEEVEGVGYNYMDLDDALRTYTPDKLTDGMNTVNGEEVFFISSPSLGLWTARPNYAQAVRNNLLFSKRMTEKEPENGEWPELVAWNQADLEAFSS